MKSQNIAWGGGGLLAGVVLTCLAFWSRPPLNSPPSASSLADSPPVRVYLAGQVHRQGVVEIDANRRMTLTQAIILDGGFADFADARKVALQRRQADGTSRITYVDYAQALAGRAPDPIVQSDDLINVPQRLAGSDGF